MGGALLIGALIGLVVIAFGATLGDLLTQPVKNGGLDFGTIGSSLILAFVLTLLLAYTSVKEKGELGQAS